MQLRLSSNSSLCSWQWPWTSVLPSFSLSGLGLQTYTTVSRLYGQGFWPDQTSTKPSNWVRFFTSPQPLFLKSKSNLLTVPNAVGKILSEISEAPAPTLPMTCFRFQSLTHACPVTEIRDAFQEQWLGCESHAPVSAGWYTSVSELPCFPNLRREKSQKTKTVASSWKVFITIRTWFVSVVRPWM